MKRHGRSGSKGQGGQTGAPCTAAAVPLGGSHTIRPASHGGLGGHGVTGSSCGAKPGAPCAAESERLLRV